MGILTRHIMVRMLTNFVLLFMFLYLFAATIDIILNLDRFDELAQDQLGEGAGIIQRIVAALGLAFNFHGPQIFQFYAYLHGLVAIGALGFTVSQMSRNRELVAMLASGISLHRASLPIVWVVFGLGIVQLLNQEFMLPRMAPLLLREHEQIGQEGTASFPVPFTLDSNGALLQSGSFDPVTGQLDQPTIIIRDELGRTVRRIRAQAGDWDAESNSWLLTRGKSVNIQHEEASESAVSRPTRVTSFATDLSPDLLTVRRFSQYTSMLSSAQINEILESTSVHEAGVLIRSSYSRWSVFLVNILIVLVAIPFFMQREPTRLLSRAVMCTVLVVPMYLFVAMFMLVPLPGISPVLGAFLPVIVLLPVAMARFGWIRT